MNEYHKIQTVFLRDPDTNFKTLLMGQWAEPEFGYLSNLQWECTEKVDGTNIRVMWDGERVRFGGKTDDAQLNSSLIEKLTAMFPAAKLAAAFDCPACLYGEGYGAKIQKSGGRYSATPEFILFDVKVSDWWLMRSDVEDVAKKLMCDVVPIVMTGTLHEAVEFARNGFKSDIAIDNGLDAEGLVMRPTVPLFNRKGQRIITKIKHRDFALVKQKNPT